MKQLSRSYWRLAWVLFTNGAVILLFLLGPIRAHHEQEILYQVMRTAAPPFSYIREFFSDVWRPTIVAVLLAGIVAEFLRSALSSILNVGPYALWLVISSWQAARVEMGRTPSEVSPGVIVLLMVVPLAAVVAVGLVFYITAFRRVNLATDGTFSDAHDRG
jgi:hypothetical protein